jgi:thioredoxin
MYKPIIIFIMFLQKYFLHYLFLTATLLAGIAPIAAQIKLKAKDFKQTLENTPNALLLDVRTQKEIDRSYLPNAVYLDFYDSSFVTMLDRLDTSRPIFVFCAIGVRSADAAAMLRQRGFKDVYDLKGGIINWKLAGLEVKKGKDFDPITGMPKKEFEAMIDPGKVTFVDFYAPWCAPCKRMVPALDSMRTEMGDRVKIITINADDNLSLMKAYNFNTLPYIMVFKNGKRVETFSGEMTRKQMEKMIEKNERLY